MPRVQIVDSGIPGANLVLEAIPESVIPVLVEPGMAVPLIVRTVIKGIASFKGSAKPRTANTSGLRSVSSLQIMCQGNSGRLYLGAGVRLEETGLFSPLRGYLMSVASCQLIGCNVASALHYEEQFLGGAPTGTRAGLLGNGWSAGDASIRHGAGFQLLRRLAQALGVPVTAGLDTQSAARSWNFLGPTLTVSALGEYSITGLSSSLAGEKCFDPSCEVTHDLRCQLQMTRTS